MTSTAESDMVALSVRRCVRVWVDLLPGLPLAPPLQHFYVILLLVCSSRFPATCRSSVLPIGWSSFLDVCESVELVRARQVREEDNDLLPTGFHGQDDQNFLYFHTGIFAFTSLLPAGFMLSLRDL